MTKARVRSHLGRQPERWDRSEWVKAEVVLQRTGFGVPEVATSRLPDCVFTYEPVAKSVPVCGINARPVVIPSSLYAPGRMAVTGFAEPRS